MLALLSRLLITGAEGVRPRLEMARRKAIALCIASFCFVITIIALIVSGWIALADVIGPALAGLAVAGIALVLGLLTLAIAAIINRRAERRRLALQRASLAASNPLTSSLIGEMPKMLKANPILGVVTVSLFAYLLAKNAGLGRSKDD